MVSFPSPDTKAVSMYSVKVVIPNHKVEPGMEIERYDFVTLAEAERYIEKLDSSQFYKGVLV